MIEKMIKQAIGLRCCKAYLGYGGTLKLSLGDKIYSKHPKLSHIFHGEVVFWIGTLSWRLLQNDSIVTGSNDDNEFIDEKVLELVDKVVTDISMLNAGLAIHIEEGYVLEAYHVSGKADNLMEVFLHKDEKHIKYNGKEWLSGSMNEPSIGFTEEERIKSNFSQSTTERWEKVVPKSSEKGKCGNCAFWLKTSGEYYFWDYGICANEKSNYDGKITAIASFCENISAID